MLRSPVLRASFAGLALLLVAGGATGTGCSSKTDETPVGTPPASKDPPAKPENGAKAEAGKTVVFAVDKLFLGDTDWNGSKGPTAWQNFGYNLDQKISTTTSPDHCKPYTGATPKAVKEDGPGGLDNSFGKNLIPIITSLSANVSGTINESIAKGSFTIMVKIDGLGSQTDYVDLPSALYVGSKLMNPPPSGSWSMFKWDVVQELLNDPKDINSAKVKFPTSYVTRNTWVSGTPGKLQIQLAIAGYALGLEIQKAVITMDMSTDRQTAQKGVIAGVLAVQPLIDELKKIAGSFSKDLCMGATFDSIAVQLKQIADINSDGGQDPSKTCDAISIGLGFSAKQIQLGNIAPATMGTGMDPCAMGQGGAGGSK
jgi:hypothetical protein